MGIMVIYLMDTDGDQIEVSAEYIGDEGNAFKLGTNIMDGVMMIDGVHLINEEGRISSAPVSNKLN